MNTNPPGTPNRKLSVALAVATLLIITGAVIYFFLAPAAAHPINGQKIIAAAHAYTRALQQSHARPQVSVPLQTLIDKGFLSAADAGSLQGLDAEVLLMASGKPAAIMTVHMPDGTLLVLYENGTIRQTRQK